MTNKFVQIPLYLIFILFSLGQLGRISFFNQQINGYFYEVPGLLALVILLFKYKLQPLREALPRYNFIFIFLLYLAIAFFPGLVHYKVEENFVSGLYLLRLIFYFVFFFYLIYDLRKNISSSKTLSRGLKIVVISIAILSPVQYFFYPDLGNLLYAGWDPHLFRLFGVFFDTSIAGAFYGFVFFLLVLKGKALIKNEKIRKILIAIFLIFIVLTFSRSLYLSVVGMTILIAVLEKWYRFLGIFMIAFLVLIFLVPKPAGEGVNLTRWFTIESRIDDYQEAIGIWQKNPLFGVGYNRIRYVKAKLNIEEEVRLESSHSGASFHSSFLTILVAGGAIGLVFFIAIMVQFALISKEVLYMTSFLAVLSLVDNIFLHPFILFFYLMYVGWAVSLSRRQL